MAFQSFLPKKQCLSTAVAEYLSSSKHLHLKPAIEICLAKHSAVLTKRFDNPHNFKVLLQDLVNISLDVSGMMSYLTLPDHHLAYFQPIPTISITHCTSQHDPPFVIHVI
jgi:hypothetical protein